MIIAHFTFWTVKMLPRLSIDKKKKRGNIIKSLQSRFKYERKSSLFWNNINEFLLLNGECLFKLNVYSFHPKVWRTNCCNYKIRIFLEWSQSTNVITQSTNAKTSEESHEKLQCAQKNHLKNSWLCFGFTDHKSEDPELYTPVGHANIEVNWIWTSMKEHPPIAETDQVTWPHRSDHKAFWKTSSPCSFSCLRAVGSNLPIKTSASLLCFPFLSFSVSDVRPLSSNPTSLYTEYVKWCATQPVT